MQIKTPKSVCIYFVGYYVASFKPGFHYPSWGPELTARVDGWPVSITRQHGPCWRARVSTSRVDGPCWRAVNSGHHLG